MKLLETSGLESEHQSVVELLRLRNAAGIEREYGAFSRTNPRLQAEAATTPEDRERVRSWIESWDAVLHEWLLADDAPDDSWRALFERDTSGRFIRRHWTLMAFWLAEVGSERLGAASLPDDLAQLSLADQARALGRFCTRSNGRASIDYAAVHDALDEELRPFLAHWALAVHLISPTAFTSADVPANRRELCAGFARSHAREELDLVPDPLYHQASYRSIYHTDNPVPFLSVLSDRVLGARVGPAIERARRATLAARQSQHKPNKRGKGGKQGKRNGSTKHARPKGAGVLLGCFGENHPVRRSTEPLLTGMRDAAQLRGYFPEGDRDAALSKLGASWAGEGARLVAASATSLAEAQKLGGRIAADRLDFLFYPEVGLSTASSVLATQRLARVQAMTYGHPSTSGSREMDYFVSGLLAEDGVARYRERLVLLPGLGVASNLPPRPMQERERPFDERACRFASLSSADKLNHELIAAWCGVLDASDSRAELQHFPGSKGGAAASIEVAVRKEFGARAGYELHTAMPRGVLLRRLQEADVLLDSFPFSGFNTLVDALSLSLPVVTLRRPGFAGGIGAAVMSRLGCAEECVAETVEEYVAKAARLGRDAGLRIAVRERLARERVLAVLCDEQLSEHFTAAVEWMRAEGPGSTGAPVLIEAGEAPRVLTDWPG